MRVLSGTIIDKSRIREEKKNGIHLAEVVLGETYLIHSYFFRTSCIAYQDIKRMYMRVAGGEFGEFPLDEYSLVIEDTTGREHTLHVERGEYIEVVLEEVRKNHPDIQIGKKRG